MAKDSIPIVFLNYQLPPWLVYTLGQAKLANLQSPVVLIGDETNNVVNFISHVKIGSYWQRSAQLQPLYRHLSPNPPGWEFFCFARWFVLLEFMKTHNLERI